MPLKDPPEWWKLDRELSPHVQDRMIERGFSEADLRLMIEDADGIRVASRIGRWVVDTTHLGEAWEVVVEPDERDEVIVVITAYEVTLP